jgi:hypothetical protein
MSDIPLNGTFSALLMTQTSIPGMCVHACAHAHTLVPCVSVTNHVRLTSLGLGWCFDKALDACRSLGSHALCAAAAVAVQCSDVLPACLGGSVAAHCIVLCGVCAVVVVSLHAS